MVGISSQLPQGCKSAFKTEFDINISAKGISEYKYVLCQSLKRHRRLSAVAARTMVSGASSDNIALS